MKINFTLILFFIFHYSTFIFGQGSSPSHFEIKREFNSKQYESKVSIADFFDNLQTKINNDDVSFEKISEQIEGETSHLKYQQRFKWAEIVGATYILHSKGQYLSYSNGLIYSEISISNQILKTEKEIKEALTSNPHQYFPKHHKNKKLALTIDGPSEVVLIDQNFPSYSGQLLRAYKFKVHSTTSLLHSTVYINAENGRLIFDDTHICTHGVPGNGESFYYGDVSFECDQVDQNEFILRDPTRGSNGINILNGRTFENITSTSSTFDLSDENYDNTALDAMYCTAKFYDLMRDRFNWLGLDGFDLSMDCVINVNSTSEYINAYWNGQRTHYGNGTCDTGPLTTLSIVGHEFMHGVTDYTSDLIYFAESGALNESLSDVFGKYLEYIEDPINFTWELDSKIALTNEGSIFRSMSEPNLYNDPDTYGGDFWSEKAGVFDDNSHVHSHSGVLNYWFYILSEGKSDINDHGVQFNVPAIGMDAAIQVLWRCQRDYLISTSQYKDLAMYSVAVANDLYGQNSTELNAILEAWKAVGVNTAVDNMVSDLAIEVLNPDQYCISDSIVEFDIKLTNVGNTTWLSGSSVLINLSSFFSFGEDVSFILPADLFPGESVEGVVALEEKFGSNFVSTSILEALIIDEKDQNHTNNSYLYFGTQYYNARPFLSLSQVSIYPNCISDTYILSYVVQSNSCQPIEEPTFLILDFYDGIPEFSSIVYTKEVIFEQGVGEQAFEFFNDELDSNIDISQLKFVVVQGDYSNQDLSSFTIPSTDQTVPVYQEGVFLDYEDTDKSDQWAGNAKISTQTIDDNSFIAHTSQNFFNRDISCKSADLIFHQSRSFNNNISVWRSCVDLSNEEFVVLSFNAKMFRNDENNDENSAMIRVSYKGNNGSYEEIIKGLNENEWETFQYDLPPNFVGSVEIELFADLESTTLIPTPNQDAIFIDDLYLGQKDPISTNDLSINELVVFPNPASSILNIKNNKEFDSYRIYSSQGKLIQEGKTESTIDIKEIPVGLYFVTLINEGSPVGNGKFVK